MNARLTYDDILNAIRSLPMVARHDPRSPEQALADWRAFHRQVALDTAEWITEHRYLTDRRRYNRARRKAVRAVLAGLTATAETAPDPARTPAPRDR